MARLVETPHLDESDLLRLVDNDGSSQELARWRAHTAVCEACASRLHLFERRTSRLSSLIAEIELPADFSYPILPAPLPARRLPALPGGWLRAAALIALLLLPIVAVHPLRAAVAEWLSNRWADLSSFVRADPPPHETTAQGNAEEAGVTLWFDPVGEELRIEFANWQAEGTLVLRHTGTSQGSFQITGGHAGETPLVSDGRLRILNPEWSAARYEIGIPAGISRLRVQIGNAPAVVLRPQEIGHGQVIALQRPASER